MRRPRLTPALLSALGGVILSGVLWAEPRATGIDEARLLEHIRYLSSAELSGRQTGAAGLDDAAAYIARQFAAMGLEPAGDRGYFQQFAVSTNIRLGKKNELAYQLNGRQRTLSLAKDYTPLNFSERGELAAQVVFAGYGITAPEYGYDDYAGVDARGKFVLIFMHEPQEYEAGSVFAGKVYTEHAQLLPKAINARRHGARGVLLVDDVANHGSGRELEKFVTMVGPDTPGVPVAQVRPAVAQEWLDAVDLDLEKLQKKIDQNLRPESFALPDSLRVRLRVDMQRKRTTVRNVAALAPGGAPAGHVIIGAHYDHVGVGRQFSMAPGQIGTVHPGADDNASGVAGLLELARWFSQHPPRNRGILFLAFAGEELGLLGSAASAAGSGGDDQHGHDRPGTGGQGVRRRGRQRHDAAVAGQFGAAFWRAARRDVGRFRLRLVRSHGFRGAWGAGTVLLLRPARRLPPAVGHVGEDHGGGDRDAGEPDREGGVTAGGGRAATGVRDDRPAGVERRIPNFSTNSALGGWWYRAGPAVLCLAARRCYPGFSVPSTAGSRSSQVKESGRRCR